MDRGILRPLHFDQARAPLPIDLRDFPGLLGLLDEQPKTRQYIEVHLYHCLPNVLDHLKHR